MLVHVFRGPKLLLLLFLYATIAGLRTVADFDLGWQMANSNHPLSSVDTLSYTVPGAPWIYPSLSGLIFRGLFGMGGYAAISLFCDAALLITVAILVFRSQTAVLVLLLVAMPALAQQMLPRSGLFTVVLAAATARLLLAYKSGSSRRLWLLPVIMVLWVNLHQGSIAGLALMLGYLVSEATDFLLVRDERPEILRRIRDAAPWMFASVLATFINPWGWRMYGAVAAQEHPSVFQAGVIRELNPLYRDLSSATLNPFDSLSAIWWMLVLAAVSLPFLIRQRRAGLAVFLSIGVVACLVSSRSQGVFLSLACLIAGDAFANAYGLFQRITQTNRWKALPWGVALAALILVTVRCVNIVSDRSYLHEDQITVFGRGASWWLPEQAAAFIEQHHLPTELFASFNLSSYVVGRLGPHYRDFADGRYLPFGDRIVAEQLHLAALPLDSDEWSKAADTWHIRSIILPLARFYGIQSVPLREDCASHYWTPVYLDTTAVVFVRNNALQPERLDALRIDCQRQSLMSSIQHSRIGEYQQLANAAVILFVLGRNQEAQQALERAQSLFQGDDSLVLLDGELQASRNDLSAAEQSFHHALALHPSDAAWYQLGLVNARQREYPQAVHAFRRALSLQDQPSVLVEASLARAELLAGEEKAALRTVSDASRLLPDTPDRAADRAELADLEAAAWIRLSNWASAISAERRAVQQTPNVAGRWQVLAAMYAATGQEDQAARARDRADSLAHHP